jgi:hypothetical protein
MQKLRTATALMSFVVIAGCATSADGIVEIGPDTYRIGGLERYADYSSSALKAKLYQDAYKHCAAKNKIMVPATSAGQNSASATDAPAEAQFQCVARSEAHSPTVAAPRL